MRAFLAIELPAAMRRCLGDVQRALEEASDGWRWTRPEGMHVTLRFLGEITPGDVTRASPRWHSAASSVGRFTIRIAGLGAFPSQSRPRVLWSGVNEEPAMGRLAELAEHFEAASIDSGLGSSDRPFDAHLTLARAAKPGSRMPTAREPVDCGTTLVSEVVLFRSELRPQGALHTPLDRFVLDSDAGQR